MQVLLLIFELLLDVRVNLDVLSLLVCDVLVEAVVDDSFELVVIIGVLDHPVDSVLKSTDVRIIVADDLSVAPDHLLQSFLSCSKVIDHETQTGIQVVVLLQLLVHLIGSLSESDDFHLARGDITSEFPDLVVKHKLKFLQFLGLFLQVQDASFSKSNLVVLVVDILQILQSLGVLLLGLFLLVVELLLLILNLPINFLDFSSQILKSILLILKFSC